MRTRLRRVKLVRRLRGAPRTTPRPRPGGAIVTDGSRDLAAAVEELLREDGRTASVTVRMPQSARAPQPPREREVEPHARMVFMLHARRSLAILAAAMGLGGAATGAIAAPYGSSGVPSLFPGFSWGYHVPGPLPLAVLPASSVRSPTPAGGRAGTPPRRRNPAERLRALRG